MIPTRYRLTKGNTFAILMALSVVLVLIPPRFKAWIGGIAQPLTWPAQLLAGARSTVRAWNLPDPDDAAAIARENELLRRQVDEQGLRISELERQVDAVTRLQHQLADSRASVIIAQVITGPTTPNRETLTIGRGSRAGISAGDWVLAGSVVEDRHIESGRERMSRAWAIGRIGSVQPYVSNVTLATDPLFGRIPVRLARRGSDGRLDTLQNDDALLQGEGDRRMRIPGSTIDYFAAGYRTVLAVIPTTLPTLIPIGTVASSRTTPQSPLHFDEDVVPAGDALALTHVYVISFVE